MKRERLAAYGLGKVTRRERERIAEEAIQENERAAVYRQRYIENLARSGICSLLGWELS